MIARNAFLNLLGHAAPLLAALVFVPPLVFRLGADRFGFLALAWVLVGYLSLLDLGLGRALTRLVAERSGRAIDAELPALSRTALSLTLVLGGLAGALLYAAAVPVAERLLRVPVALQSEATQALRILAFYLPFVTMTAALRGILEGGQRFGWVNAIRIPLGILTFAAPLVATEWSSTLPALVLALAVPRLVAALAHWLVCWRIAPALTGFTWPRRAASRELLSYGGWLTVSNVVGPLMVYVDRFVIAAMVAMSAVAYYAAPYEVVTRLWLVPAAVTAVLFPAMASATPERLALLYRAGIKVVLGMVFPIALLLMSFAAEGLEFWLGERFAAEGTRVAQLLCFGAAVNCLTYVPFTLLQARGNAALTAKTHLVELPLYSALLAFAVDAWGIEGAALAWCLRCVADAGALFILARRVSGSAWGFSTAQLVTMTAALVALATAMVPATFGPKALYFSAALIAFVALAWLVLLDDAERAQARHPLALFSGQPPA
jgi:O-antigen/teichoic acid export membrane protein